MDCQLTIKNLKINKNKSIGKVIVVVEGEEDEFRLLKHIFVDILEYNYVPIKRNRIIQYEFQNKFNKNSTVIVANTKSSSIKSIIDDEIYKDKLYNLLKEEYHQSLKNVPIYILWDRDKSNIEDDSTNIENYRIALDTFSNAWDNGYEMNGLLLLSYPCHEAYNLSHFTKRFYQKKIFTSKECKRTFGSSRYTIQKMSDKTVLFAIENMNKSLNSYGIKNYDTSQFKHINNMVFRKEEECFKKNHYFNALSLISIMLIDLGIIEGK